MLTTGMMVKDAVLRIDTYRDEKENFTGRVVEVRDTHEKPVDRKTHKTNVVTRSRYLLTLERVGPAPADEENPPTHKSFYHAFVKAEVVSA